jgi:ParB family chromosome partitioning protein
MKFKVDQIKVGRRHRRDMGDIDGLAKDIEEVGLLHPIVLNSDDVLVAGARRLDAVKKLGWDEVNVTFVSKLDDAILALKAERSENTCRKDFTRSESVALGNRLLELERPQADERRKSGLKRGTKPRAGKLPAREKGRVRDKVADAVGMSGKTYEKAKQVVELAEAEPELYEPIREEMDRTGKVDPAHKKAKRVQALERDVGEPTGPPPAVRADGVSDTQHERTLFLTTKALRKFEAMVEKLRRKFTEATNDTDVVRTSTPHPTRAPARMPRPRGQRPQQPSTQRIGQG